MHSAVSRRLVGTAMTPVAEHGELTTFRMGAIALEVILGYLTCTGSLVAAGKLQEVIPTRPIMYRGQNIINFALLCAAVVIAMLLMVDPGRTYLFPALILLALAFGVLLVLPIGGADMPTVISLLNSYAGLAAVAMGFVMENKLLITAGALDGASGLILSIVMCKAMNRRSERVVRRVRQVQAGGGQWSSGPPRAPPPKTPRSCSRTPRASSSFRATEWQCRRRSIGSTICTSSSPGAASTSSSRFTRWLDACRGT
jgi:NAD/NADP transhydrogenase beta subunit